MKTIRDCMKRNVVSIRATATVREAAALFVARHIGLLPVVDVQGRVLGVLGLRDLLTLELPAFVYLVDDVDFVHDFGAVETTRPAPEMLAQPVTSLMRPATTVPEDCGLLRAYALMYQRDLHDLPVVAADGSLVGIASRVDIATAVLASWQAGEAPGP
jgi:CBS domain-containing membrane protein